MKIAIDLTPLYNRKKTGVELYAVDLYNNDTLILYLTH